MTISTDLKKAAIKMTNDMPISRVATYCNVSERTIRRILKAYEESGDVSVAASAQVSGQSTRKRGRPKKLNESDQNFLKGLVDFRTDIYLDELAHAIRLGTGKQVHPSTVLRTLNEMEITNKNLTRSAMERDPWKRAAYELEIADYEPNQLVFLDESYCDKRNTSRLTGWSKKGERAVAQVPFLRGRRYSILPALSLSGVLDVEVLEGAVNGDIFCQFVENLTLEMLPYPGANSVLVMDNVKFHLRDEVREILEDKGMRVVYLPPYSPDLNPIEAAFGCAKAWIRRHNMEVRTAMCDDDAEVGLMMMERAIMESVTAEKAAGWFRDCGYY